MDGKYIAEALQSLTTTVSGRYYLKFDFGSVKTRRISIEIHDQEFGGVVIGPTDTLYRTSFTAPLLVGFGDSHVRGASSVLWPDTWVRRVGDRLSLDWANLGIGSSGFLNDNGTTGANFRNRLNTDVVPLNPDVVLFEGSWNDSSASEAALFEEATYCFSELRKRLPKAILVSIGPWVVGHNLNATMDAHDETIKSAAKACGWSGHISFRDPLNRKMSTSAWAPSTVYAVGNTVTYNGFVQICTVAHTSTSTFNQTNFRSTAIVNGTGKTGAPAGNGSADVLILSDGTHATLQGHSVKAAYIAQCLLNIAYGISSGNTWVE